MRRNTKDESETDQDLSAYKPLLYLNFTPNQTNYHKSHSRLPRKKRETHKTKKQKSS